MNQNELLEIKTALENRLEKVESDINMLCNELEEIATYENIDDIEDLAELETLNDSDKALLKRLMEEKKQIKKALAKIERGEYGKCSDGSEIPIEILKANPLHEC
ncbi:DnaK suppressor protein [Nitratiruptor sp. YY08-26]|uniref:TraR/DksA family transcriptional regulator n=1 Tax=unclassified Nitratiruptor TaxID=2624044 RepID=UPI00191541BE|nr:MULTISPECIES: hypothetical protein [unclassified Nitratiruptor]BCD62445.1 DnaK suppressor protein [Nitratiruptor sp. YY08-13]BCD66381.1 DnaK suppressor protein [Nitratiruptor sp. YY08-26]